MASNTSSNNNKKQQQQKTGSANQSSSASRQNSAANPPALVQEMKPKNVIRKFAEKIGLVKRSERPLTPPRESQPRSNLQTEVVSHSTPDLFDQPGESYYREDGTPIRRASTKRSTKTTRSASSAKSSPLSRKDTPVAQKPRTPPDSNDTASTRLYAMGLGRAW
ncbi:hypothetical protein M426DRAFT_28218 [Hypoxylon sp. CI-4A]|nr:hypothetical protein M426DRAFT_28218 [Hypoxylon sp. CI-4A]